MKQKLSLGVFSTYVPREDGIATFTRDLIKGMRNKNDFDLSICAIADKPIDYPNEVKLVINQFKRTDYKKAADWFNKSKVDVVLIEHEFGIFGGPFGRYVLDFLKELKKPSVITLHTVPFLQTNRKHRCRLKYLKQILPLVNRTIVPITSAIKFFIKQGLTSEVINNMFAIPHGAPNPKEFRFKNLISIRKRFGFNKNDIILTTFGLITPYKGIHFALIAVRKIINRYPNIKYIVAGRPHPYKPISYYNKLKRYVNEHNLFKNIIFIDQYLTDLEVKQLFAITDIYLTPYLQKNQVSSGTLSLALAAGKTIISTPYPYAKEMLANSRGKFIDYGSSESIIQAISELLNNTHKLERFSHKAKLFYQKYTWPNIGYSYFRIINELI